MTMRQTTQQTRAEERAREKWMGSPIYNRQKCTHMHTHPHAHTHTAHRATTRTPPLQPSDGALSCAGLDTGGQCARPAEGRRHARVTLLRAATGKSFWESLRGVK
jgi:hypothetical protein